MSTPTSIFFLGATGYLGSQILVDLARDSPQFHIQVVALVRSPSSQKEAQLKAIYPNLSVVEGTLDDDAIIQEQAAKADIVINTASSDHLPSVESILAGLERGSAVKPGRSPLYLHISGLGVLSDNSRGEHVNPKNIPEYTDIGFKLEDCPPMNLHLESDRAVVAAGTRKERPICTIIIFPGWIYGVGEGLQKTTLPLRIFLKMYKQIGFAGTWGPGLNSLSNIHIKDVATGCITLLKAALEGRADEGAEGLYFAASMEPKITTHEWASKYGDILYSKGLLKKGGSQALPGEVVDPMGHYGWSLLGGNQYARPQRLQRLGWKASESAKISIMESLPAELDIVLQHDIVV